MDSREDRLKGKRLYRVASCHPDEKEEGMTKAEAVKMEAVTRDI